MDKALEMAEKLAAQLGVALEELWPHFVRRAWISGLVGTLVGLMLGAVGVWLLRQAERLLRGETNQDEPVGVVVGLFGLAGVAVGVLVTALSLPWLFAPAAYAAETLLGLIR